MCAAQIFGTRDRDRIGSIALAAAERYRDRPWPSGVPGAGESPGRMLGLAGIGYFFLRLLPDPPPSVLPVGPRDLMSTSSAS
ncbi:MAG: hypothetical protein L0271_22275 [Gemmatimonadetes bacterium]|nr:hypothetical protein [Gemmatimonadota bacterium]